jgi:transcriptional regulator with XRE-family HTH domain
MKIEPAIGNNVKRIRLEKGLTQDALAREVGIATRHIGRIERGTISATIGLLARIAKSLGCEIGDLIEEKDAPMPPNLPRGRTAVRKETEDLGPTGKRRDLPCLKTLTRSNIDKTDLEILQSILFQQKQGDMTRAAEQMVSDLIERVGGIDKLTDAQRRNIELARAWAAAKDTGVIDEH